jgi:hypothetical protein
MVVSVPIRDYDRKSVDYFNFKDNRLKFFKIDHLKLFSKYSLFESVLYLESSTCMEGSVLIFLKAEWKVSNTGLAHTQAQPTEPLVVVYYCKTGPCFALMNPKYFHTTLFFISWMFITFWNLLWGKLIPNLPYM